jgi:hypothetical protein
MDAFKELPLVVGKGKSDLSMVGRGGIASAQAGAEMQIINSALGNSQSIIEAIQADTRIRRTNISTRQDYEELGKTGETAAQALSMGLTVLSKGVNSLAGVLNETIDAIKVLSDKFSFSFGSGQQQKFDQEKRRKITDPIIPGSKL